MDTAQAIEVNSILLATMAGAMVVLAGALYAFAFAVGKLARNASVIKLSYLFYAILVVATLVLARTLNFSGVWNIVAVVMLAGYFVAPHGIWKLCVGTHVDEDDEDHDSEADNFKKSNARNVSNRSVS